MAEDLEQQLKALATRVEQLDKHGDKEQALSLAQAAYDLSRKLPDTDHPLLATAMHNLAFLYQAMGSYAQALPLFEQALGLRQRVLGPEHPHVASSMNNLALLYKAMGSYAQALPLLEQALGLHQRVLGPEHPHVATSMLNLGVLYSATARPQDALFLMEQALAIDALMLGQVFSIGSEQQRMTFLKTQQADLHVFFSLVWQHFRHDTEVVQRTFDAALRRKALGAEALFAQREAILGGAYPALEPQLHQLHVLRMQIAQKTLAGPGPEGLSVHQERLAQWNTEKEQLEAALAREIHEMNLARRLRAVDRQVVAWALPDATTLVEFVRFSVRNFQAVPSRGERQWQAPRYVAFVLPAGEPDHVQMIDLGEALPIDQMIAAYRAHLIAAAGHDRSPGTSHSPGEATGTALRTALFDPLARALPDGCNTLLLAPDGVLSQLPFEVLPMAGGGYLTDTVQITYLSAGRDVLRFEADTLIAPTAPLIAADPDFDLAGHVPVSAAASSSNRTSARHSRDLTRGGLQFQRLPGTAVEGERIAALLGVTPWLADRGVETPLKSCRSPRILHLATHGGFLPDQSLDPEAPRGDLRGPGMENPMLRSFLVTAGVNAWLQGRAIPEEAEDGILTAEDVSGMNLLGTELVVLSACDTGMGEVEIGEGVLGLRRAFMLAGAQTLVMSLWKVSDMATAIVMEKFYTHLLQGHGRAQALRQAQDELRRLTVGEMRADWLTPEMILRLAAGDPDVRFDLEELTAQPDEHRPFDHPYFWGAFICQGVPAPLGSFRTDSRHL